MASKANERKFCKDVKSNKKVHFLQFSFQENTETGLSAKERGNDFVTIFKENIFLRKPDQGHFEHVGPQKVTKVYQSSRRPNTPTRSTTSATQKLQKCTCAEGCARKRQS